MAPPKKPQDRKPKKPINRKRPRLRLLKVAVQPVFVIDDGENVTERAVEPIIVQPADWPDYPAALERERKKLEATIGDAPPE
jgi:hypothetical protein